jgi:Spy/CpxP family protein refolding chaperone
MKLLKISSLSAVMLIATLLTASAALAQGGKGYGKGWKMNFTDKQRTEYMKLKLAYKKKKMPLVAKKKQLKVELALLMTADKPNKAAIGKKLDEIAKVKRQKMQTKIDFKIAVRGLLTAEQKVKFDLRMMKKSMKGKKRCRRGHKRGYHRRGHMMGRGYGRGHGHRHGRGTK